MTQSSKKLATDNNASSQKQTAFHNRYEMMKCIRDEVVGLKESPLYEYRTKNGYHAVLGEGSHEAKIMFIGEAPGENEAKQGRPFCGAAGRILDELLESIGLNRPDVYITNIVKDRPPGNRDPEPDEIELYAPFLMRQIDVIQPKVIATLGRFSTAYIMDKCNLSEKITQISAMHGHKYSADRDWGSVDIIPLYHPAVALYKASMKQTLLEDFQVIKAVIELSEGEF